MSDTKPRIISEEWLWKLQPWRKLKIKKKKGKLDKTLGGVFMSLGNRKGKKIDREEISWTNLQPGKIGSNWSR